MVAAESVVALQAFLLQAATAFAGAHESKGASLEEILASAAGLDYALLLASEHGDTEIRDHSDAARSMSLALTRASLAALDAVERMLQAPNAPFDAFIEDNVRSGRLFETIHTLQDRGAILGGDVAFRALTVASDVLERRG